MQSRNSSPTQQVIFFSYGEKAAKKIIPQFVITTSICSHSPRARAQCLASPLCVAAWVADASTQVTIAAAAAAAAVSVSHRRNAFDVALDGRPVWAGLSKGPPRALKFAILDGRTLYDAIVAAAAV